MYTTGLQPAEYTEYNGRPDEFIFPEYDGSRGDDEEAQQQERGKYPPAYTNTNEDW
jgi:hypothetical protein